MRPKSFVPVVLLAIAICGLATSRAQETKNATSRETPSERLKLMQGNWEVAAIFEPSLSYDGHFPKEIVFAKEGAKITIKGNELICDGRTIATMANDMSLAAQRAEKGFEAGQSHLLDRGEVSQRIITRQASGDSRRRVAPRQGGRTCGNDCATLDSFAF